MTQDELYELLEEARAVCGRHAGSLSEYLGARLPNDRSAERTIVEDCIYQFTGKRVILPAQKNLEDEPPVDTATTGEATPGVGVCTVCGLPLRVGEQGCIFRVVPHTPALSYHPFVPYFDIALGKQINSLAERWAAMRPEREGDMVIRGQLDYREKMSRGDLSARRDRVEERRKQQRLGNSA